MSVDHDQDPSMPDNYVSQIAGTDVVFGRTVVPTPLRNKPLKKDMLGFEYAEHSYIGDAITITLSNGNKVPAIDHKFTLPNALAVTYGQINGLAGDFYGTKFPISDGKDAQEQSTRFAKAYSTLADPSSRQPSEARNILDILQTEVDAVNDALHRHEDPSIAYHRLPDVTAKLQLLTFSRPADFPSYLGLAGMNWDHFGSDARVVYNAGHALALQTAADGDLNKAYSMNAFADHFLEDAFSAGHLRTPRRGLHGDWNKSADICAKFMHDEDCAIGLSVRNRVGQSWTCYGDKRALDEVAADNLKRCVSAVQASADEIYTAYTTKKVPRPSHYNAWILAPTLESAIETQTLTPLFQWDNEAQKTLARRDNIENRRSHKFILNWWFASTAIACKASGWWNYPITIDGPPKVVPRTGFAVTTPRTWSTRLYYQNPLNELLQSVHVDGQWTGGVNTPGLWDAAPFTPLAAINWDVGSQLRVYYLSTEYKLQEYSYEAGQWTPGKLNDMSIQAARDTSIAAFHYMAGNKPHIRVYCQEEGSTAIKEFCNDGVWYRGTTLTGALRGTGLAAFLYGSDGREIRLYYQAEDLTIRESCKNDSGWFLGALNGGKAPGRTAIGALYRSRGLVVSLDVYWMNAAAEIVRRTNTKGVWHSPDKVVGPLRRGAQFAPAQWEGGKHIRVYYQAADNSVKEICNDDDGRWSAGGFR